MSDETYTKSKSFDEDSAFCDRKTAETKGLLSTQSGHQDAAKYRAVRNERVVKQFLSETLMPLCYHSVLSVAIHIFVVNL